MSWKVTLTVLATLALFTNGQLTRDQMAQLSLKARKLPNDICGESIIDDQKTINGSNVQLGEYPWMAAIGYTVGSESPQWMCGGTLVTDQFVVTTAHCIDPRLLIIKRKPAKISVVRLGDLDLDDSVNDGASPLDIEVESTKFHPDFNNRKKINDIGLIKLKTKVQIDALKKPICLPSPEFYENSFVDFTTIVIGWGTTETGQQTALSETSMIIKDLDGCRKNLTSIFSELILDERVICAASPGQDACKGDSGGPLMMYRRYKGRAKMFLLGVVSYGFRCAIDGYPGVYTRVSYFMDWIIDNLEL